MNFHNNIESYYNKPYEGYFLVYPPYVYPEYYLDYRAICYKKGPWGIKIPYVCNPATPINPPNPVTNPTDIINPTPNKICYKKGPLGIKIPYPCRYYTNW